MALLPSAGAMCASCPLLQLQATPGCPPGLTLPGLLALDPPSAEWSLSQEAPCAMPLPLCWPDLWLGPSSWPQSGSVLAAPICNHSTRSCQFPGLPSDLRSARGLAVRGLDSESGFASGSNPETRARARRPAGSPAGSLGWSASAGQPRLGILGRRHRLAASGRSFLSQRYWRSSGGSCKLRRQL